MKTDEKVVPEMSNTERFQEEVGVLTDCVNFILQFSFKPKNQVQAHCESGRSSSC